MMGFLFISAIDPFSADNYDLAKHTWLAFWIDPFSYTFQKVTIKPSKMLQITKIRCKIYSDSISIRYCSLL